MALAILQSLPDDVTGHIITSPVIGDRYSPWHRGLVIHRSPVLPGDVTGHVMTGPHRSPFIDRSQGTARGYKRNILSLFDHRSAYYRSGRHQSITGPVTDIPVCLAISLIMQPLP
ncbi:hypothetical protein DPMN_058157 [Dreissena polymorpha]|uniref:Uncharacterized protein n=1 Tax=Dreissena polymorpha TaxID=45954 RepID=A0A9D4C1K4_DREPO|nr:hypothetical protein DPMN_058157 [Dreissena polymorpha]